MLIFSSKFYVDGPYFIQHPLWNRVLCYATVVPAAARTEEPNLCPKQFQGLSMSDASKPGVKVATIYQCIHLL